MSFFDTLFNQFFSRENKVKSIDISENLLRSDKYIAAYQKWRNSTRPVEFSEQIAKAYQLKKAGVEDNIHVSLYNSVYANGFFFTINDAMDENELEFIFDYFKERVLDMGYFLATSDRRIREKNSQIEEIQKHFLKPKNKMNEDLLEQLYGNVLIEYVKINGISSYIKIMANVYSDSKFKKPLGFDEFMEKLPGRD
ncbi:MAG: hypothetical protein H0V01_11265 [Bacteroidetes bacterium]|nr:hypothetical protein [Bacteroidota bacterium]HET6243345.1 hypothetical protein [Bacteroidia bacterium]